MLNESLLTTESIAPTRHQTVVLVQSGTIIADSILRTWGSEGTNVPREWNHVSIKRLGVEETSKIEGENPDLVVLVCDTSRPEVEHTVLQRCRVLGIPLLSILGKGSILLVGPLEAPGQQGCVTCLQLRWDHSMLRTKMSSAVQRQQGNARHYTVTFSMTDSELISLADTVVHEIRSILGDEYAETKGTVGIYRRDGSIEWVPLLPSHDCPRCNARPIDDSDFGRLQFHSKGIEDTESLRIRKVDHDDLQKLYVHRDVGYISSISDFGTDGSYVRSSAHIQTPNGPLHVGHGSGFTVAEARKKAILEVVERMCAVRATGRKPVVFASYAELGNAAVNPLCFGLHDDEFFKTASSWFEPYSNDKRYSWVWANSTKFQRPILVPEQIAYYGAVRDAKRFIKDSSSGCALGTSLEEATLYGIFEVLERDGFLNTWYGKMPVPELRLGDHCSENVYRSYKQIQDKRYEVRLFNISHDIGIPAILAVAIQQGEQGPTVVSGSSCHLNAYEAVDGALRELMVQVLHIESISEKRRDEGREMVRNPARIQEILDHVVAASLPEAFPRWHFLLQTRDPGSIQSVEEAYQSTPSRFEIDSGDIRVILESVLAHLHAKGFDVIVVNQTNVEAAYGGLFAAKTMIPGMTPITFGCGSRRAKGLTRVFELPYQMGYASHVLDESELNENCHPLS